MGGWWGCHGLNLRELGEKCGNFLMGGGEDDFFEGYLICRGRAEGSHLSSIKPPHFRSCPILSS